LGKELGCGVHKVFEKDNKDYVSKYLSELKICKFYADEKKSRTLILRMFSQQKKN